MAVEVVAVFVVVAITVVEAGVVMMVMAVMAVLVVREYCYSSDSGRENEAEGGRTTETIVRQEEQRQKLLVKFSLTLAYPQGHVYQECIGG